MNIAERVKLVLAAMPAMPAALTFMQQRQLQEVLHTLAEAGELHEDDHNVEKLWGAVELVRTGKFTEDMRL